MMIPSPIDEPWSIPDDIKALTDFSDVVARFPALARFEAGLGNTSLVEVPGPPSGARVLAKLEWENPVGSIKDRVAFALLCDALRGTDDPPRAVMEYSGGNLAAALSALATELGLRLRVVLSSASAPSLLAGLAADGTEVDLVDRELGFIAVIEQALRTAAAEPGWHLLYQHRNPVNVAFHEATTGEEMVRQLDGRAPAAWVASIGTGGSLVGVLRALRRTHPDVAAVGVSPSELPYGSAEPPNGLPKYAGSGGFGNGVRQPFVRAYEAQISAQRAVSLDDSLAGMRRLVEETGMRIGTSAAANWIAAQDVAAQLPSNAHVVTIFPDAGSPEEWAKVDAL